MNSKRRLIVVSNRLPVTLSQTESGVAVQRSSGGLVSALLPIVRQNGGLWVGWTGSASDSTMQSNSALQAELAAYCAEVPGGSLIPVFLTKQERDCFYRGCSNEIIWPLFHDMASRCVFNPSYWGTYCTVNDKFAQAVENIASYNDLVWVHDYHLMMLAEALVTRKVPVRLGYFHHIPFPPPDVFQKLPWRKQILRALLQFHTIGFQTVRDRDNFLACAHRFLDQVRQMPLSTKVLLQAEGSSVFVGAYPISIDFEEFTRDAASYQVTSAAHQVLHDFGGTTLILGLDRLDYTKGILERLRAFEILLATHPEWREKVTLVQVTIPSREEIADYRQLKADIEELVGRINAVYKTPGWSPVHHLYRSLSRRELLVFYRAATVALVTPLNDGMNLVAKEFCAARVDEDGVLILSEFAGSAQELGAHALLVNPYDSKGLVSALTKALRIGIGEQQRRMKLLRAQIQRHDVFHWASEIFGSSRDVKWEKPPRANSVAVQPSAYASVV
jgi:alpha,alpha-trehalose-phosphate synthase [UDP-forming]